MPWIFDVGVFAYYCLNSTRISAHLIAHETYKNPTLYKYQNSKIGKNQHLRILIPSIKYTRSNTCQKKNIAGGMILDTEGINR